MSASKHAPKHMSRLIAVLGAALVCLIVAMARQASSPDDIQAPTVPHVLAPHQTAVNESTADTLAAVNANSFSRFNTSRLAMIIETRPQPQLLPVILYFMSVLRDDWPFLVYHTAANAHLLRTPAAQHHIRSGKLQVQLLPPNVRYSNYDEVSAFLTNKALWEGFAAENILFFQADAILCANSDADIEDYLHFDWIGAPWPDWHEDSQTRGGNGGLSLRRRSRMLRVLEKFQWTPGVAEDVFYSKALASFSDANLPTHAQSAKFSHQMVPSDRPIGIHKEGANDRAIVDKYCPEAKMLSW
ncbi:hypothetical protein RI367_007699 [Sorochytrium milnesiophthora]